MTLQTGPGLNPSGDSATPEYQFNINFNINLPVRLGCLVVVATQHDHFHEAVDQRYNPFYSPTLFSLLLVFLGA